MLSRSPVEAANGLLVLSASSFLPFLSLFHREQRRPQSSPGSAARGDPTFKKTRKHTHRAAAVSSFKGESPSDSLSSSPQSLLPPSYSASSRWAVRAKRPAISPFSSRADRRWIRFVTYVTEPRPHTPRAKFSSLRFYPRANAWCHRSSGGEEAPPRLGSAGAAPPSKR